MHPRVEVIKADQGVTKQMDAMVEKLKGRGLLGTFDIITEDGSHKHRDQQLNLAQLLPLVRPGGTYVIEDLQTSFQSGYDVPSRSAQTTAAVLKRWNETGRLSSSFLTAEQAASVEDWVESWSMHTANGCEEQWTSSMTCVFRKRPSPRKPDREQWPKGSAYVWRNGKPVCLRGCAL